jgi:apolipoprotein N-acyltransferase
VIGLVRDRSARRRLLASLGSGLLLVLAFPPFDVGLLALVALVPLLWAWRDATPARAALYGFVFGVVFFGGLMYWLWYFGPFAIVPLVAACAAYTALSGLLVGWFARIGVRGPWLVAAAWVVPETLRGRFPLGGMPWGEVGVALHDFAPARALASWGGVALVSFVAVAVNALVLDLVLAIRSARRPGLVRAVAGLGAVLLVVLVATGFRYEPDETGRLRVALLQGNDQNRDLVGIERDTYLPGSHLELAESLEGPYDLIVFPESSLGDRDPQADPALRDRLLAVAERHDADVLANAIVEVPGNDDRIWNMNLLYEPDGTLQGRYAKQHLVPYGEYVPGRRFLGFIDALEQIERDFKHGDERVAFEVDGHEVGTVICFESAFGPLVRDFVRDGAEMIVVSTNNRSYRRSANAEQHLALSQMRAAETGRPVLHASVSGITGVIDRDGDVVDRTKLFRNEAVTTEVVTATGETPFVRYGEWVVGGCALGLLVAAIVGRLRASPEAPRRLPDEPARRGDRGQ